MLAPASEPPAASGGVGEAAEAVLAGLAGAGPGAEALAEFERAVAAAGAWRGGGAEARAAVERTVAVLEAAAVSEKPTHEKKTRAPNHRRRETVRSVEEGSFLY